MSKKLCALALLSLFIPVLLFAQKENNIWAFGIKSGLNFNGPVTFYPTQIMAGEGAASICDAAGNLLFYTNGTQVWDNTHHVMPNGSGILGHESSTMGEAIVAIPEHPGLYFLFTVYALEWSTEMPLRYSLIDMSMNGGKGDVVPGVKNIELARKRGERITVASGCKCVWLITHHSDSAIFYAYKITGTSIPAPIVSPTKGPEEPSIYCGGEMRFTPDFKHLAMGAQTFPSLLQLFDFDNTTGLFSGYTVLDSLRYIYNVTFSPDGSKLYATSGSELKLFQYDLTLLPDVARIRSSRYDPGFFPTAMRCAPDDKIYLVTDNLKYARINNPNIAGAGCNVEIDIPELKGATINGTGLGNGTVIALNTIVQSTSYKDTLVCEHTSVNFAANPAGTFQHWNDGNTEHIRRFTEPGKYWFYSLAECHSYIDTIEIKTFPRTLSYLVTDTTVCFAQQALLRPVTRADHYLWDDGSEEQEYMVNGPGKSWVLSYNENDCLAHVDSFNVDIIDFAIAQSDTGICKDEKIVLNAGIHRNAQYLWSDASTDSTLTVATSGVYSVEVSVGDCHKHKDVLVAPRKLPLDLGEDRTLCKGEEVTLSVATVSDTYQWQDGSNNNQLTVRESGIYIVNITQGACKASDTVAISFVRCLDCITIPNAFTPNNDGRNDYFSPVFSCPVQFYELKIYNRYGQEVFQTRNIADAWNGAFLSQPLDIGTYFFLIRARFDIPNAATEIFKGDISLVR
jgi:gliding motility-associated-like protein